MVLIENRTTPQGTFEIPHDVKPHKAKLIKQLPGTKLNYRTKNAAGGRKAMFSQSREYKNFQGSVGSWAGYARRLEALELRAQLVAMLESNRAS